MSVLECDRGERIRIPIFGENYYVTATGILSNIRAGRTLKDRLSVTLIRLGFINGFCWSR